jgi:arylsulfatase
MRPSRFRLLLSSPCGQCTQDWLQSLMFIQLMSIVLTLSLYFSFFLIDQQYPFELPRELSALNYTTIVVGKNHFEYGDGKNAITPPPSHGWSMQYLYDGLGDGEYNPDDMATYDDYDRWFNETSGGQDPLATGKPLLDWNSFRGAPYIYNESWHPTAWVRNIASSFLKNYSTSAQDQPFLLKVSFHRPHSPYDPPNRLLNTTLASDLPPVYVGASYDEIWAGSPTSSVCGPSDPDAWCGKMPEPDFTLARRAYRASIRYVDEQIGLLLDDLNTLGLAKNTWIVFISDHGDGQGDHNLWRKCYPYELSAHVPGLIVWPETTQAAIPRGSSSPLLAELRDVFPTLLDIAGRNDLGVGLNGTSWACLVKKGLAGDGCGPGGIGSWRSTLDMEHSLIYNASIYWNGIVAAGPSAGSLSGLKYIFWAPTGSEQLFDLNIDPNEMNDVAGDASYKDSLLAMRARLVKQFLAENRGPQWVNSDGELLKRTKGQTYSPNYPSTFA